MPFALRPVMCRTEAEWAATTIALKSRQLGYNETTGEFRLGPGLWHACPPVDRRANTEVVAATTGNITIATGLNVGDTVDGVALADGDLVLVKSQTTASQNGIYVAGETPARAGAYDTWAEHVGKLVRVKGGTQNKNKAFFCAVAAGGTLNTTAITFDETPAGVLDLSKRTQIGQLTVIQAAEIEGTEMIVVENALGQLKSITLNDLKTWVNAE